MRMRVWRGMKIRMRRTTPPRSSSIELLLKIVKLLSVVRVGHIGSTAHERTTFEITAAASHAGGQGLRSVGWTKTHGAALAPRHVHPGILLIRYLLDHFWWEDFVWVHHTAGKYAAAHHVLHAHYVCLRSHISHGSHRRMNIYRIAHGLAVHSRGTTHSWQTPHDIGHSRVRTAHVVGHASVGKVLQVHRRRRHL